MAFSKPVITPNEWITGIVGVLVIISMLGGGLLFMDSRHASAGTVTEFRAEHMDSGIENLNREIRQLVREKRRAPATEHHYFDADIKKLEEKIQEKKDRKQNILEGLQ